MTKLKSLGRWLQRLFAKQVSSLPSDAPSLGTGSMDATGPTRTDHAMDEQFTDELSTVVHRAYMEGIAICGDWARSNAQLVSAAASRGLITTRTSEGLYGRTWRPTHLGMALVHG